MTYQKLIIIGAPRSGTNMLRDVLTSIPGWETWSCDEINYIWRHGNARVPHDEFTSEHAGHLAKKYIRKKFDSMAKETSARVLVEKTCANSLRVPFVNAVIPDAKYIFIIRDGLDVVGSAKLRWSAPLDIAYLLDKIRYVPLTDIPFYGFRYLANRIYRVFSGNNRLAFWGPQLIDMQEILQKYTLEEVCAIQWERCVLSAINGFSQIPDNRIMQIRYEQFVKNPGEHIASIMKYIDDECDSSILSTAISKISDRSVGKGRETLSYEVRSSVIAHIGHSLKQLGYEV